tara:strand:- start:6091 stop:6429 length:339 start_codon:yes stop_codon:yes gene_type:complete
MGIRAKELRIGNLVNCLDETYEVSGLGTRNDVISLKGRNLTAMNLINGIVINEKLLIKLGFNFNGLNFVNQFITIDSKDNCFRIWLGSCFVKNIKYVHELQNLFYVLTNKEL